MFVLNEHNGSTVSLDFPEGDLYTVLSLLGEAASKDGFHILVDKRIKGNIRVTTEEPWNTVLVEILTGFDCLTVVSDNIIAISLWEERM
jgi:hypothetical protein